MDDLIKLLGGSPSSRPKTPQADFQNRDAASFALIFGDGPAPVGRVIRDVDGVQDIEVGGPDDGLDAPVHMSFRTDGNDFGVIIEPAEGEALSMPLPGGMVLELTNHGSTWRDQVEHKRLEVIGFDDTTPTQPTLDVDPSQASIPVAGHSTMSLSAMQATHDSNGGPIADAVEKNPTLVNIAGVHSREFQGGTPRPSQPTLDAPILATKTDPVALKEQTADVQLAATSRGNAPQHLSSDQVFPVTSPKYLSDQADSILTNKNTDLAHPNQAPQVSGAAMGQTVPIASPPVMETAHPSALPSAAEIEMRRELSHITPLKPMASEADAAKPGTQTVVSQQSTGSTPSVVTHQAPDRGATPMETEMSVGQSRDRAGAVPDEVTLGKTVERTASATDQARQSPLVATPPPKQTTDQLELVSSRRLAADDVDGAGTEKPSPQLAETTTVPAPAGSAAPPGFAIGPQISQASTVDMGTNMPDLIVDPLSGAIERMQVSGATTVLPGPNGPQPAYPQQAPQVAQQVAQALANADRASQSPIEIALDPPELGRLRMGFSDVNGVLTVTIAAERPETADLMRRHIALLTEEFAKAGLDAPSVDISGGGQSHSDQKHERLQSAQGRPDDVDIALQISSPQPSASHAGSGLDLRL